MKNILMIALGLFTTNLAFAFPMPHPGLLQSFPTTFTANYNFEGIVALSNCSGSLVRFESSRDNDHAMIITNGHCLETGFPQPGTSIYGQASSRVFRLLGPDGSNVGRVNANLLIYGTMTKTDMGLYRLQETYADILRQYQIHPLTLSSKQASEGTALEVISGYWRKGYSCQIEKFITHVREDVYTWDSSMRYSRPGCEVIGGTSGSPVVQAGTRIVIGLNNTGNEDGESCTRDNPCEVDDHGNVSFTQGFAYGQQAYWLYSCLNSNNEVDLATAGCLLTH